MTPEILCQRCGEAFQFPHRCAHSKLADFADQIDHLSADLLKARGRVAELEESEKLLRKAVRDSSG